MEMIRVKDPVCGKEFDLHHAEAHEDYRGWAYFFCSDRCHQHFLNHRDRFVGEEQREARLFPQAKSREVPHG
jgi:YHS domain-containing protein